MTHSDRGVGGRSPSVADAPGSPTRPHSLVLKPKGNLAITGNAERVSSRGRTRIGGSWPVVRLWELEADALLAMGDPGLIPWVPLTRTAETPDVLMTWCRDRLAIVPNPTDRAGLMAVTQILAGLAFPDRRFLDLFGGARTMIESPVLDEVKEILRKQYESDATRRAVVAVLEARFGSLPAVRLTALRAITDETRLQALIRLASTCQDLDTFAVGLVGS